MISIRVKRYIRAGDLPIEAKNNFYYLADEYELPEEGFYNWIVGYSNHDCPAPMDYIDRLACEQIDIALRDLAGLSNGDEIYITAGE